MTSAISHATPKPLDIAKTKELAENLVPYGVQESDEELDHRYKFCIFGKRVTFE